MTRSLSVRGRVAALHEDGSLLAAEHSPRPYLHPVLSPAGRLLTEIGPADHPHHLGLSLAVPDVNGTHHWGGKTYVPGEGYVWLANHGRQVVVSEELVDDGVEQALELGVTWHAADGSTQLEELRRLTIGPAADAAGTRLSWRSVLTAAERTSLGSPGSHGRAGAGYGGIFWRLPGERHHAVLAPGSTEEDEVNGSHSAWVAMRRPEEAVTLVLRQAGQDGLELPWFVRVEEYPGLGPALAWEEPVELAPGQALRLGIDALIVDEDLRTEAEVEGLLAAQGWSA